MAAVVTERIATRTAERVTTSPSPLDSFGGPSLELAARAHPSIRPAIGELITQLRVSCGSLVLSTRARAYSIRSPGVWRTLRQTPDGDLVEAIRRVQRDHPDFTLPRAGQTVHRRIEYLLERIAAGS
jgi:hypothetical protein